MNFGVDLIYQIMKTQSFPDSLMEKPRTLEIKIRKRRERKEEEDVSDVRVTLPHVFT